MPPPSHYNLIPLKGKVPQEVEQAFIDAHARIDGALNDFRTLQAAVAQLPTNAQLQAHSAIVAQALASMSAFDTTVAGVSTAHKGQSSILPTVNGTFAYTSSTSGITWYWDGTNGSTLLTIMWPDGSTTPVPPANFTVGGLSASTTYRFYPYFDTIFGGIKFAIASGGLGSPAAAYSGTNLGAAAIAAADTHVSATSNAMTAATTSSGSGGGSGGGRGGSDFF